ncbi:MAG: hypothetical protein JWM86_975 [Thermoleophilia bacterium]|nr:hypothetical protein [Thermoleophilia bacterium]
MPARRQTVGSSKLSLLALLLLVFVACLVGAVPSMAATTDRTFLGLDAAASGSHWNDVVGLLQSRQPPVAPAAALGSPTAAAGDNCGFRVASGDVNGDGLADVVTGCQLDATGASEAGSVVVYVRNPANAGFLAGVELANPTPVALDHCGYSVAVGDVNGDGFADIATGCKDDDTGAASAGNVVVFVRNASNSGFLAGMELSNPAPAATDQCGFSVAIGDVDADGRGDVATGCNLNDAAAVDAGSFVLYRRNGANTGFLAGVETANPDPELDDRCGWSIAAGDVNADGRADLALGCMEDDLGATDDTGSGWLFLRNVANTAFDPGVALANPSPMLADSCGISIAVGDVSADGRADVALGCASDDTGANNAGEVAVFVRNASNTGFNATIELTNPTPVSTDYCGAAVGVGDTNGDGVGDVVAGCWGDDTVAVNAGSAIKYERNGSNSGFSGPVEVFPPSPQGDDRCGEGIAVGDTNGDSRAEIIFGCKLDDTGGTDAGNVLIVDPAAGSPAQAASFESQFRRAQVELSHLTPTLNDRCGTAVAYGDVNGDGRADAIMGCTGRDIGGGGANQDRGVASVRTRNATNTGFDAAVQLTDPGGAGGDQCGTDVATGDVNADGRDDVVLGCGLATATAGRVVVFLRNATNNGFVAGVALLHPSPLSGDGCGDDVAVADLDGDGRDDVAVGCRGDDQLATDAGSVVAFLRNGANTGFSAGSVVTDGAFGAGDRCGSVAAGDVNADGVADLVVGCDGDATGAQDAGRVLVLVRNAANTGYLAGNVLADAAPAAFEACGTSVASGDVDDDGRDDVVAGCSGALSGGANSGSALAWTRSAANTGFDAPVELTKAAPAANDECGAKIAVGDVDGTGTADVVMGCSSTDVSVDGSGSAVVFTRTWANTGFSVGVELNDPTPLLANFCDAVATGDVHGDGRADVLLGCSNDDTGASNAGNEIVFGWQASADISSPTAAANEQCGSSVASADVNDDGRSDALFGCPGDAQGGSGAGGTVVAARSTNGESFSAVELFDPTPAAGDACGTSVGGGDINGDGLDDVVQGCPTSDGGASNAGSVIVHLRDSNSTGFLPGTELTNPSAALDDQCGLGSVVVGDVNGDGLGDVVVGCPQDDPSGAANAGSTLVFVRSGTNTGFDPAVALVDAAAAADDACGSSVAVGDVNGDGFEDVFVGCGGDDTGGSGSGNGVLFLRNGANSAFLAGTPIANPSPVASEACRHVAAADVSGDHLADLAIGCPGHDAGVTDAGGVGVYVRNSANTGFDAPVEVVDTTTPVAGSMCSIPALGDVDADGRQDLVIGCSGVASGAALTAARSGTNAGFDVPIDYANPSPTTGDACWSRLAVGDVNADGRADVLAACPGDDATATNAGSVAAWVNQTRVNFQPLVNLTSRRMNRTAMTIAKATITPKTVRNGSSVTWQLSANGGSSWEAVSPGVEHTFAAGGTDLRFRAVFDSRASSARTAVVHDVLLAYASASTNAAPTAPTNIAPPSGSAGPSTTPQLVARFNDPDVNDTGSVQFEVCQDAACSTAGDPIRSGGSSAGIANGSNGAWAVAPALPNGTYYWRARGVDQDSTVGPFSTTWQLVVGAPSITLAVDSTAVSVGPTPIPVDGDATVSSVVTVGTNSRGGYALLARDQDDTWAASTGSATIADWGGPSTVPTTWGTESGYFGLTVRDATGGRLAKWGAGTGTSESDFTNNLYAGLDASTDATLHQRTTFSATDDAIVVGYRIRVGATQPAGVYSSVVTYTATALP